MSLARAKAFAPASVGNVAVGFDIMGFAVDILGDTVVAEKITGQPGMVTIEEIISKAELPSDPLKNTASVACQKLLDSQPVDFSVSLKIEKGIPLSSGLGGSASSAVAAVKATNALLPRPLTDLELLPFAVAGETVASGAPHADNVAPSLLGGLQLLVSGQPQSIPVPAEVFVVLLHPHIEIETKDSRAVLNPSVSLSEWTTQSSLLAGLISACYESDYDLISRSLKDVVVEPQRAKLIPGFADFKNKAMRAGALGFSISGAGPTLFAWARGEKSAKAIAEALKGDHDIWVTPISQQGARMLD